MSLDFDLQELFQNNVSIQRLISPTDDDYGNPVATWTTISTVRGRVEFDVGREDQIGRDVYIAQHRVFLLPETDVIEADRIRFGTRLFDVSAVAIRYDDDGTEHHRVAYMTEVR